MSDVITIEDCLKRQETCKELCCKIKNNELENLSNYEQEVLLLSLYRSIAIENLNFVDLNKKRKND